MVPQFLTDNIPFFVFLVLMLIFLYYKREKLSIQGSYPFFTILMLRTKLGLDKMNKWSKKHPKIFLYLSYLSIFIGLIGAVGMIILMIWQLGFIVDNNIETGGGLVLPVKSDSSYIFYVPFWFWIISIFILMVVHEFAHGVISERFNIPVKSSGLAFFGTAIVGILIIAFSIPYDSIFAGNLSFLYEMDFLILIIIGIIFIFVPILPGAFVEPDEKHLHNKPRWQQIAVFGAGSTSNFLFGFLFLLIWIFAAVPLVNNTMEIDSISFSGVMNDSSLLDYNVTSGKIIALNGIENKTHILNSFSKLEENQQLNLTIETENSTNTYPITTFKSEDDNRTLIGIYNIQTELSNIDGYKWLGDFPLGFERLFFWMWFLNIAIGMMNLLPIWITDGGQIARVSLEKFFKPKTAMSIFNFISLFCLLLIFWTIFPSFIPSIFH